MSALPPGFVLDSAPQGGPVYGPPKAPAPVDPLVQRQRELAILKSERDLSKPEGTDAPPSGYRWGPGGTLVPIPGGPADKTGAGADPADRAKIATLESIVGQINEVERLYNSGIRDETLWNAFGALDAFGPTAGEFDAAGQGMADQGLAAFRIPGVGSQSDRDALQFAMANTPQAGDWDSAIEQKLKNLRGRVDANRAAFGLPPAQWGVAPAADEQEPAIAATAAGAPPPGPDGNPTPIPFGPGDPQYQAAQGTRTVEDPAMAAVADRYRQMLAENRPTGEIIKLLRDAGAGPQTLMAAVAQAKYRRENPQVPIDRYSITSQVEVPTSTFEQVTTDLGSNAAGAYAIGAGQFLSGNTLDNMAGDPERARLAQGVAQAENPGAYGAGEFSGGMLAGLTGEAGLARLGMASGILRGAAADGIAGAANGAGMADGGDRFGGAVRGALAQGGGSLAGGTALRVAGNAMSPTGGSLADLYASGVRPTIGQRVSNGGDGRGLKGMVGGAINATEEALQSVPIVGSAIRGARQEARDQFQVGAFNEALKDVGEALPKGMKAGTDPHVYTAKVFEKVYDEARSGMVMVADEQLATNLSELAQTVGTLSEPSQKRFAAIYRNIVERRAQEGQMGGEAYKKAQSELGKVISSIGNSKTGDDELASALTDLSHALDASARRHSDPEAVALLDAADRGYAKYVRIKEAGKRRGGGAGEFTPTQLDAAVQKESSGPRSEQYLRGEALMQDYASQGMSLADKLPNSGSADRIMAGYAMGTPVAGASMWANPLFAGLYAGIGTAYAPGVRRATKGVLAPSAGKRKAIAAKLKKIERLAGGASGALALQGTAPSQ